MNKSVLVVKTPENCWGCEVHSHLTCTKLMRAIPVEGKLEDCPLRPLPEKQKLTVTGKNQIEKKKIIKSKSLEWIKKGYIDDPEVAFYCGYNACRSEIAGEIE